MSMVMTWNGLQKFICLLKTNSKQDKSNLFLGKQTLLSIVKSKTISIKLNLFFTYKLLIEQKNEEIS